MSGQIDVALPQGGEAENPRRRRLTVQIRKIRKILEKTQGGAQMGGGVLMTISRRVQSGHIAVCLRLTAGVLRSARSVLIWSYQFPHSCENSLISQASCQACVSEPAATASSKSSGSTGHSAVNQAMADA